MKRNSLWLLALWTSIGCQPTPTTGSSATLLTDRVAIFSPHESAMLSKQLDLLRRETGVALTVETVALEPGASLERYTTAQLDRDEGDEPGATEAPPSTGAARMTFDTTHGNLRLAVGYSLEQLFPDAYVGFWIREHARYLFDANQPADALLFAVRMLRDRIRSNTLAGHFPPRRADARRYEHGGAGASDAAPLAAGELDPFPHSASAGRPAPRLAYTGSLPASYARPGKTVEAAHRHYLSWLAEGHFETQLALFTPGTQEFLHGWPMTPGYLEHILTKELGKSFEPIVRGDRALLYCVDDPFVAPHFFERSVPGWRIDLAAEAREVVNLNGGPYSWSFRSRGNDWLKPFSDQIVQFGEVRRLSRGDNRTMNPPQSYANGPQL